VSPASWVAFPREPSAETRRSFDGRSIQSLEPTLPSLEANCVEDFSDCRMIHEGERLTLGLKTRRDFACMHARSNELQRDAAAYWCFLLCKPHLSHAAAANELQQMIGANHARGRELSALPCAMVFESRR